MKIRKGVLIGSGIAIGTIPTTFLATGVSSGSTTSTTSTDNVPAGTYTEDQAVSDGYLTKKTVDLPDGGTSQVFTSGSNGSELHIPIPPDGFSPLVATPAQLQEYGFPPRPSGGVALQSWLEAMQAYTGVPNPSLVIKVSQADQTADQASPASPPTSGPVPSGVSASNWSGWDATGGSTTYIALSANASVPNAAGSGCGANSKMSLWTGLGGNQKSKPLIQNGLDFNNLVALQWVPFYELMQAYQAGNIQAVLGNPAIALHNGDGIYMYTDYQLSNSIADFFVEDTTTGQVASFGKTGVPKSYYDGSSADWIAEDFNNNILKEYAPLGLINLQAEVNNGNWKNPGSTPNEKWYTVRGFDNHVVQYPSALAGGSAFSQYWGACN